MYILAQVTWIDKLKHKVECVKCLLANHHFIFPMRSFKVKYANILPFITNNLILINHFNPIVRPVINF